MLVKFTFGSSVATWNNYTGANVPSGTIIADLDDDGGSATGIGLSAPIDAYSFSGSDRVAADFHTWPEAVWDGLAFESGGDMIFRLFGLAAYSGQSYTLKTAHFSNSARDNDVTVGGTTLQYNSVSGNPPAPLEFTGTVSGDTLDIEIGRVSGTTVAYFTAFTLELTAPTSETATTGNIPLVIQAGYTKVDLVNPVTTNASLLFGRYW